MRLRLANSLGTRLGKTSTKRGTEGLKARTSRPRTYHKPFPISREEASRTKLGCF
jgi:hypothetical protein